MKFFAARPLAASLVLSVFWMSAAPGLAWASPLPPTDPQNQPSPYNPDFEAAAQSEIDTLNAIGTFASEPPTAAAHAAFDDPTLTQIPPVMLDPAALQAAARAEADYILSTQFLSPGHPAHGAINNVHGDPTWVVPRENALAILNLIEAAAFTGDSRYLEAAALAADYLVRVQDADGGWFDQYSYADVHTRSKSPTQTAEVMMALQKLGYDPARAEAMRKGAQFLLTLQDPANKTGQDDGLIGGGKDAIGNYHAWRWASDNSFAYWAFRAAMTWAEVEGDTAFAVRAAEAAGRVLAGINEYLYIDDPSDDDYGVWKRAIDGSGAEMEPDFHEWINYAPQMLDLPAVGVGSVRVGEWIHEKFQQPDGAVVWNDTWHTTRKSPGFSFQAALVWYDLGQTAYANAAVNWALRSGLQQTAPDINGNTGGWIDWVEPADQAPFWQRFVDTSFYAASALRFGYDFGFGGGQVDLLLAHLQGDAGLRADFQSLFGVSVPASGKVPGAVRGRLYDIAFAPGFDLNAFIPALRNTAALARGLAADPVKRADFNLVFDASAPGVLPPSNADLIGFFAIGGDPGFVEVAFWSALSKAADVLGALRSDSGLRAGFNALYGAGLTASGPLTAGDRTILFGVAGSPGLVVGPYLSVMRSTAALLSVLRNNSTHRSNFNGIFGTSIAVGTALADLDRQRLFEVAGSPGYAQSKFLSVLTRTVSLWSALRSNSGYRADFNLLYGTGVAASGLLSVSDRTRLFGVAGSSGFVRSKYLPVLSKAAALYRSLRSNQSYRSAFDLLYGTSLPASGAPSGSELARIFGVAGTKGFKASSYLPILKKAADLVRALRSSSAKRKAFNKKFKVSLSASGAVPAPVIGKVFAITGTKGYNQSKFLSSLK